MWSIRYLKNGMNFCYICQSMAHWQPRTGRFCWAFGRQTWILFRLWQHRYSKWNFSPPRGWWDRGLPWGDDNTLSRRNRSAGASLTLHASRVADSMVIMNSNWLGTNDIMKNSCRDRVNMSRHFEYGFPEAIYIWFFTANILICYKYSLDLKTAYFAVIRAISKWRIIWFYTKNDSLTMIGSHLGFWQLWWYAKYF